MILKLFALFLIFSIGKSTDACNSMDDCITSGKKLIYIPLKDAIGNPRKDKETFDLKVYLLFSDKITFYFSHQNPHMKGWLPRPMDLARRIPYSDIILSCGTNGNKLCTAKEFLELYSSVNYLPSALDTLEKLQGNFGNQCLVIPIIDNAGRPIPESLIYFCETDPAKVRKFYQFRDKLSRLIDQYQINLLQDHFNAANAISRKESYLKSTDALGIFNKVFVKLVSQKISIYKTAKDLSSHLFSIELRDIKDCLTISKAKEKGLLVKGWDSSLQPKPIESCCFALFLHAGGKPITFCIHYLDPSEFDYMDCDTKARAWSRSIRQFVTRVRFVEDLRELIQQLKNEKKGDCRSFKQAEIMKTRLINVFKYQKKVCSSLQQFFDGWSPKACNEDTDVDLNMEKNLLSGGEILVRKMLDECTDKGYVVFV